MPEEDAKKVQELTTNEKFMRVLKCQCCKKPKPEGEEDEDWSVIITPVFSSGESDEEDKNEFKHLPEDQKTLKVKDLWRRTHIKAIGGARIIRRFSDLSEFITIFGASKKIDLDIEEEIIPLPIVLMPENPIKMFWNFVIMMLLLYTATFVPYRTAFIDEAP